MNKLFYKAHHEWQTKHIVFNMSISLVVESSESVLVWSAIPKYLDYYEILVLKVNIHPVFTVSSKV